MAIRLLEMPVMTACQSQSFRVTSMKQTFKKRKPKSSTRVDTPSIPGTKQSFSVIGPDQPALVYYGANYFRQRIVLSTIFRRRIRIRDIRINEPSPGLKDYEYNLLRLIDRVTDGSDVQIDVTGCELYYKPGQIIGGDEITHDCGLDRNVSFFLEALLLLAPFGKKSMNLCLRGITHGNVSTYRDPSVDYFRSVLIPFMKRIGLDGLSITVAKRGVAPLGGGEIKFECPIVQKVEPFQFLDEGRVKRIRGTAFTNRVSSQFCVRMIDRARGMLNDFLPDVWIYDSKAKGGVDGRAPGYGITLIAETIKGFFKGADLIVDGETQKQLCQLRKSETVDPLNDIIHRKTAIADILVKESAKSVYANSDKLDMSDDSAGLFNAHTLSECELIGRLAAQRLLLEIHNGGVLDTTFQHIPFLFMALAEEQEPCKIKLSRLTPYAVQFLRHLADFGSVTFSFEELTGDLQQTHYESESEDSNTIFIKSAETCVPAIPQIVASCVGIGFRNIGRGTF